MTKLQLPTVTLLAVDTVCHELSRLTLEDCLAKAEFADVLIFSDRNFLPGARHVPIEPFRDRLGQVDVGRMIHEHLETPHSLAVHWDAGMLDVSAWRPEFLEYDYIGAPWGYPENNVGCSGFVLRSKFFFDALSGRHDLAPYGPLDDASICRTSRQRIETEIGLRWSPTDLALDFAFERVRKTHDSRHFGYHGTFNWPFVYDRDQLAERVAILLRSDYARERGMLQELLALMSTINDPDVKVPVFPWRWLPEPEEKKPTIVPAVSPAGYLYERAINVLRAGKREEALDVLTKCLRADRRHAAAWSLRGRIEGDCGRPFNAMLHHELAVQADPKNVNAWVYRGTDAASACMFDIAQASYERAMALDDHYAVRYNYANLCTTMMDLENASRHYAKALEFNPHDPQLHANFGTVLMATGRWRDGFQLYRNRFNAPGFPPRPNFTYPIWHGEDLSGKTILLYVEQGFGDEIQSLRFAKSVQDLGARVIVSVRPMLYRLVKDGGLPGADAVIMQYGDPPWEPDYMCALLDVPSWIDITEKNVPLSGGYLKAEDRGFELDFGQDFKVGVCWQSGIRDLQPAVFQVAQQKSLTFKQLGEPLASREGVTLISLQKENGAIDELRRYGVKNPMDGVQDFADTAWIINQLDLVVTVDTAVAHLAGALGKPVWNLVRFDGIWPWMRATDRTCWYDSMMIYRQPGFGNWAEPLGRLQRDFDTLLSSKRCVAAA